MPQDHDEAFRFEPITDAPRVHLGDEVLMPNGETWIVTQLTADPNDPRLFTARVERPETQKATVTGL